MLDVEPADGQLNESSEQPKEPHNQSKKLLEKESGPKNDEKNMVGSNQTSIQYKDSSICGLKKPKDEYDIEIRRLSLDEMKTIDPKDLSQYLYTIILSKDIKDVSDLKSVIDPIQDIKQVGDMQWQGVITTNTKIMASGNAGRDFKLPEIMENTKVCERYPFGNRLVASPRSQGDLCPRVSETKRILPEMNRKVSDSCSVRAQIGRNPDRF